MSEKTGMRTFSIIWVGQLISTTGSGLTAFALGVWLYQQTGLVTPLALLLLFRALPVILLSPVAGVLVDRWNRRTTMIAADSVAALTTLILAFLFLSDHIMPAFLYALVAIASAAETFQGPAFLSSITRLVPQEHYGRASGMTQVSRAVGEIVAPLLAGLLIVIIKVQGILLIDFITFLVAVTTLFLVRIPMHASTEESTPLNRLSASELTSGFRYVAAQPGLAMLLMFLVIVFFLTGFIGAYIEPLVLSFTSPQILGTILSTAGVGLLTGSLLLSAWGGPQKRITGVLVALLAFGLFVALIGLRANPVLIAMAAFGAHFAIPFYSGLNQALWQAAVEEHIQGRVFALQQMAIHAARSLAFIIAGPLADKLFEPLMSDAGALANSVGRIMGTGAGRGIGLIFTLMGLLTAITAVIGMLNTRLQQVGQGGVTAPIMHKAK